MNKLSILTLIFLVLIACKEDKKEGDKEVQAVQADTSEANTNDRETDYPRHLTAVIKAHGGIDQWKAMNNLCFEMKEDGAKETHTISLQDRRLKIQTEDWTLGYDGSDVWLLENETDSYRGNARFYHNLMFYFYAMPFVLGDDGITYTTMEPTILDGKTYDATKIGYDSGIGDSPKDEYIMYSNPDTNTMEWLAYTVTYGKDEKSDAWNFIKYDEWEPINGLLLPKKLTWYNVENNKPTDERNDLRFKNITITETVLENSVFKKPANATLAEK